MKKSLFRALAAGLLMVPVSAFAGAHKTIDFWVAWSPSEPDAIAMRHEIAKYEKAHPDVHVKVQDMTYSALHEKLITALAAGQGPDLSWGLPSWMGELYAMHALMNLNAFKKAWPARGEMYPQTIKALTIDGKLVALPHYLGVRALLSHKSILAKADISAPPTTWDELIADAKRIKAKTGTYGFGIAASGVRAPQELIMYLAQEGLDVASEMSDGKYRNTWTTNPDELAKAAHVFQFYGQLVKADAIPAQAATWGWQQEDANFARGDIAMAIDGPWMKERVAENPKAMADVEISAPPIPKGGRHATFFEVNPYFVFAHAKHPKATLAFAKFLTSKPVMEAATPGESPRKDVQPSGRWGAPFAKLIPTGVEFPPVPLGGITHDMAKAIEKVTVAKASPKEVATWLSHKINDELASDGELSSAKH